MVTCNEATRTPVGRRRGHATLAFGQQSSIRTVMHRIGGDGRRRDRADQWALSASGPTTVSLDATEASADDRRTTKTMPLCITAGGSHRRTSDLASRDRAVRDNETNRLQRRLSTQRTVGSATLVALRPCRQNRVQGMPLRASNTMGRFKRSFVRFVHSSFRRTRKTAVLETVINARQRW
jgi:hypothetical protein